MIRMFLWGLVFYFIYKIFKSFSPRPNNDSGRTANGRAQARTDAKKSYDERDVVDAEFKDLGNDK